MKRLKKILKWTGIALGGLAAILLIANAVFVWTTDARLERQLAEISAAGDPLTLADLARKPIPPEKNAATYLRRAEAEVTAIENEIEQWIEAVKNARFLAWYFSEKHPMPEKMHKAMKAIYAAHPKVIGLLQKAADCPDYDAQLDYSLPPEQFMAQLLPMRARASQRCKSLMRIVHGCLQTDGNCDEAARMALAIFRLARHIERNPMLVGYLVALTVQGIAVNAANRLFRRDQSRRKSTKHWTPNLPSRNAWRDTPGRSRPNGPSDSIPSDPSRFAISGYTAVGIGTGRSRNISIRIAEFLALAPDRRPYRRAETEPFDKTTGRLAVREFRRTLFSLLESDVSAVTRARAMIRCLRVLNALQTHVPAGSNEIPKLTELGLPAETTTDPFNRRAIAR